MDLQKLIADRKVVIFDGALGTELSRRGLETGGALSLTHPEHILDFHREYSDAGVDILTTSTFTMNRISAASHNPELDLREVNIAGVSLARQAAQKGQLVYGDLGPTGKLLEPYGTYTEEQFYLNFREQASILAEAGADGLIIETMTDLREAICALKGCKDASDLPVIVTLSFATTENGGRTIMGARAAEIAVTLEKQGADAIGANCGELSPIEISMIVKTFREHTSLPVLVQPNAGKPKLVEGRTVYEMSPDDFAEGLLVCIENGAALVGGCCGTTLEHMKAAVQKIRLLRET
jgi:5-methyltetrahydrofolate--homocysteine methyltransferase